MKTFADIIAAAESLGWNVIDCKEAGFIVDEDVTQLEFCKMSPAGEDFSFTVEGHTPDELADEISAYSADFDCDDHVGMWVHAKESGTAGVPRYRDLVEDSEAIQDMLRELSEAVTYGVLVR